MTTLPFSAPKSPDTPPSDRYFEATIPAPGALRFNDRLAGVFQGLVFVLVDAEGKPADAKKQKLADLRLTLKTTLDYEDSIFGWVRGWRIRQEGERIGIVFEPQGRSDGRVEGLYCDLMAKLGVTEVADVTTAWKTSEGIP